MAYPYATEYTNELNQKYLSSLLNPIEEDERAKVAQARNEGVSGGLIAQASTGSRIGAAEAAAGRAKNEAISGFNWEVANTKHSERLTDESRAFTDAERMKMEDFQREMTKLGYAYQSNFTNAQNRADKISAQQGAVIGAIGGAASRAIGGYFGGLGKAAGGNDPIYSDSGEYI